MNMSNGESARPIPSVGETIDDDEFIVASLRTSNGLFFLTFGKSGERSVHDMWNVYEFDPEKGIDINDGHYFHHPAGALQTLLEVALPLRGKGSGVQSGIYEAMENAYADQIGKKGEST